MRRLVVVLGLVQAANAAADATVSVTLNEAGNDLAGRLGISVSDLVAKAEGQIDELYKVSRIDQLLEAFANTAAFSQRGLGVDYDVDPGDILVGFAAAGVHGDVAIGTTNDLLGGSIINYSAMAGMNLGRFQHPRWTVFANGFYETTTVHGLEGHMLTLGGHVQYQLVPPTLSGSARWTGVAVTTGIEYARWTVGMATAGSIPSHFTATGTGLDQNGEVNHVTIHMESTGTLDVLTSTVGVPIEVTTGVRLGALSLYTGGGVAFTTGDSTINAVLDSVLSINSDHLPVGDAVITGSGESSPSAAAVHALAGLAIHTRHARVFLQGAFAPSELSVSLGVRIAP